MALRNLKVMLRLGIGFVLMAIIPLAALGYAAYSQGSAAIDAKMGNSVKQTMDQAAINISNRVQTIINDGIEIAYSDLVQNALNHYNEMGYAQRTELEKELSSYINRKYVFSRDVEEITLYTIEFKRINAYGPSDFRFLPKSDNLTRLLNEIKELDGRPRWVVVEAEFEERLTSRNMGDRKNVLLGRVVKSLETGDHIGYMLMRMEESTFAEMYRDIDTGEDTMMFLLNTRNMVISSAGEYAHVAQPYAHDDLLRHIQEIGQSGSFDYTLSGEPYLASFSKISTADWYIVSLVPFAYLYSESYAMLKSILIIGLFLVLFALAVNFVISKSIITPIRHLVLGTDAFMQGDLNVTLSESGHDELWVLTRSFNAMTAKIRNLIDDIRTREKQKRELEIRALQAQINPHFLANALQTVSYLASLKHADNAVKMVNSIITMLNGCMRNDSTLVPVKDEISLLKSYAVTQEYRMFGRFELQLDVAPEVERLLVPRFLLQPIVENALIHGIEPSDNQGLIYVRGCREGGCLLFSITDNGVGIEPARIERLLSSEDELAPRRFSGIGISNVNERIRLLFGKEYGLQISSVPGVFTTVTIKLPMLRAGEEERHG